MKTKQQNNLLIRIISVLLIIITLLPLTIITYVPGKIGNIIGLVFYFLLSVYCVYEILKNTKMNIFLILYYSLMGAVIFLMPMDKLILSINEENKNINFIAQNFSFQYTDWISIIVIMVLSLLPLLFEKNKKSKELLIIWAFRFLIALFIPLFLKLLWIINITNIWLILLLCSIAACSDTFGLFGGMLLGKKIFKRPMAPKISPKKTWEGTIFSIFTSFILAFVTFYFSDIFGANNFDSSTTNVETKKILLSLILAFVLPIAAILGDLLFSLIKRKIGIKDFSNLIKGHGGMMDRFDSTFLVIIVFSIIMMPIVLI